MNSGSLFTTRQYLKRFFNTFCPKFFLVLSPRKNWSKQHWKKQEKGNIHGYDNYASFHPRVPILISELDRRLTQNSSILDLGCNCGYYLSQLREHGFRNLTGIDISRSALEYGKSTFNLDGVELIEGSFEDILPQLAKRDITFYCIYSMGATVELVHPSFDIIKNICRLSSRYIILIISEWGHSYPRLWEYEFNRQGFALIKCIRPFNGEYLGKHSSQVDSLLVFQRVG